MKNTGKTLSKRLEKSVTTTCLIRHGEPHVRSRKDPGKEVNPKNYEKC